MDMLRARTFTAAESGPMTMAPCNPGEFQALLKYSPYHILTGVISYPTSCDDR